MISSAHCAPVGIVQDSATNGTVAHNPAAYYEELESEIRDEFKTFLDTYHNILHKATTYKLMASHGRNEELLYYATIIGDHERVISHWVVEKNWSKALEVLSKQVYKRQGNFRDLHRPPHIFLTRRNRMFFTNIRQFSWRTHRTRL